MTPIQPNMKVWSAQPAAERLFQRVLTHALSLCPFAKSYAGRLLKEGAVRLADLVDYVSFDDAGLEEELRAAGWRSIEPGVWRNELGRFPDFIAEPGDITVAFRVENLEQFQRAIDPEIEIKTPAFAPLRQAQVFTGNGVKFVAIERNGFVGYDEPEVSPQVIRAAKIHLQRFHTRRREFDKVEQGLAHTETLIDEAALDLGKHWTCDLFFRAERAFWMARNDAGRWQKKRQDDLGIGWANIDHHTYDSSRPHFQTTIRILEKLGFECRELFYAGHQAGWGSQVLEQPVLGNTIFADIDLAPHEIAIDFAHMPLAPLEKHRRAGLWCAMHGESMLEAGLNHVAGLYDRRRATRLLEDAGFQAMAPFSDLPHLYQELTQGQWRAVDPQRIDELERQGHLDRLEAESFRLKGAIATHLENMERNEGYKGFNQPGIDGVLKIIDPRANREQAEWAPKADAPATDRPTALPARQALH